MIHIDYVQRQSFDYILVVTNLNTKRLNFPYSLSMKYYTGIIMPLFSFENLLLEFDYSIDTVYTTMN